MLVDCQFVSLDAIMEPVNLWHESTQLEKLEEIWKMFEYVRNERYSIRNEWPRKWLTIMIIRSYTGSDLEPIFSMIAKSGFLGAFDWKAWGLWKEIAEITPYYFQTDGTEAIGYCWLGVQPAGFWLPVTGSMHPQEPYPQEPEFVRTTDPETRLEMGIRSFEELEECFVSVHLSDTMQE